MNVLYKNTEKYDPQLETATVQGVVIASCDSNMKRIASGLPYHLQWPVVHLHCRTFSLVSRVHHVQFFVRQCFSM